jgi:GNAT superfamily N-acetyltransferase
MERETTFRRALPPDYPRIEAAYATWGYGGGVSPDDELYLGERGAALVAVVRKTHEDELVLLRGMYVAPELQRQGIGSRLLDVFVGDLEGRACYCVPYRHLRGFYARGGFAPVLAEDAPEYLKRRRESYRERGLDVLIMRRSSSHGEA